MPITGYNVVLLCLVIGQIWLIKFAKSYKIQTNIDRNFKSSVAYSVILFCAMIEHTRSHKLRSKVKKLINFVKAYEN